MRCTKDYGLTVDDIDWSCPTDLEPYEKYGNYIDDLIDSYMWTMGVYMSHSIATCFSDKAEYPEVPLSVMNTEEFKEKKLQRERMLFATKLQIMADNFNMQHKIDSLTNDSE